MASLFIPVILGTARKGRRSEHVARFVFEETKKRAGVETEFVDICKIPMRLDDAGEQIKDPAFSDLVTRADGLILVVPEYNHGYPGLLKHALDMNLKEFMFGNGIGAQGNDVFETRLRARGLTHHLWYNAHNQYITTLFSIGLSGLILLSAIIYYCIHLGIKTKNVTLISFTMLTAFAMSSESIFERASGTAFFCVVMLLLSNPGEDSLEKT